MMDFCNERPFTAIALGLGALAGLQLLTSPDFAFGVLAGLMVWAFFQSMKDG